MNCMSVNLFVLLGLRMNSSVQHKNVGLKNWKRQARYQATLNQEMTFTKTSFMFYEEFY